MSEETAIPHVSQGTVYEGDLHSSGAVIASIDSKKEDAGAGVSDSEFGQSRVEDPSEDEEEEEEEEEEEAEAEGTVQKEDNTNDGQDSSGDQRDGFRGKLIYQVKGNERPKPKPKPKPA